MAIESIGPRPRPAWIRGPAKIDGDEIILDAAKAKPYDFLEPGHYKTLLPDLASLRDLALQDPVAFTRRHGLLWHGPDKVAEGQCRESLQQWRAVGQYLTMTISLYVALTTGLATGTAAPIRDHLWAHRDVGWFIGSIPDDDDECLEYASIQLAEMITRGLEGSKETIVAACSILRDGEKEGPAGDFRYVIETPNLVASAYKQLASLVVTRAEFRECKGCGRLFQPDHGRQIYHTKDCGRNRRVRDFRERQKAR